MSKHVILFLAANPHGTNPQSELGAFLRLRTCVDLRRGVLDQEGIDRLVWAITGLRPAERARAPTAGLSRPRDTNSARFRIENPKNGDFLFGPFKVSGLGPPRTWVCLYHRSPDMKEPRTLAGTETDDAGRWEVLVPGECDKLQPGPHELHASDSSVAVKDPQPSQVVTVFYRDATSARRVARRLSAHHRIFELRYELHTAFVEATKLKKGRRLLSGRLASPMAEAAGTAAAAGDEIAARLRELVAKPPLDVRVTIDADRRVHFEPETAWASYYAFPWAATAEPPFDIRELNGWRHAQRAWQLTPHVDRIPETPFEEPYDAASMYLEVRHDGYRPEFVALKHARPRSLAVRLQPVLHKRIAVLDFPCEALQRGVPSLSQLIAQEIADAIERQPELGTFGYFSDAPKNASPADFLEDIRPIEIGNEVLTLRDVQAVQAELESVDTGMISGEGRDAGSAGRALGSATDRRRSRLGVPPTGHPPRADPEDRGCSRGGSGSATGRAVGCRPRKGRPRSCRKDRGRALRRAQGVPRYGARNILELDRERSER